MTKQLTRSFKDSWTRFQVPKQFRIFAVSADSTINTLYRLDTIIPACPGSCNVFVVDIDVSLTSQYRHWLVI